MKRPSYLCRKALFFDYDGVIADTEPLHWKSWAALLRPYGYQLEWEEYCRIARGVDDMRVFEIFSCRIGALTAAEFAARNLERKQLVREWSLAETPIPPETAALLQKLEGYCIGLVTSSERAEVEPVLRAARIYDRFDVCVFGEDVTKHKPSPDPYLLAVQKLGAVGGVVFEDSVAGLVSARAAGLTAIQVAHPEELSLEVARFLVKPDG